MNYASLLTAIRDAHQQSQEGAAGAVNRHLILRNWLIGAYLVQYEQNGEDRAEYGARLIERVASDLKSHAVGGLGASMLKNCRTFYRLYPQIRQSVIGELRLGRLPPIRQALIGEFSDPQSSAPVVRKSLCAPTPLPADMVLRLSWTHLLELIRLDDPWKRAFYENECLKGNWSVRQLQRQIGSLLYERTGLSTDKQAVIEHARQQAAEASSKRVSHRFILFLRFTIEIASTQRLRHASPNSPPYETLSHPVGNLRPHGHVDPPGHRFFACSLRRTHLQRGQRHL